jgi:hypothetical protein
MRHLPLLLALTVPVAGGVAGCASSRPPPQNAVGYAQVTYGEAPAIAPGRDVESYPHTWYQDHPVYLIAGRWWYRGNDGRWAYYTREPDHLTAVRKSEESMPSGTEEQAIRRIDPPTR